MDFRQCGGGGGIRRGTMIYYQKRTKILLFLKIYMYTDDLILVSGYVFDLQYMINSCIEELHNLDVLISAKKSSLPVYELAKVLKPIVTL